MTFIYAGHFIKVAGPLSRPLVYNSHETTLVRRPQVTVVLDFVLDWVPVAMLGPRSYSTHPVLKDVLLQVQ